MNLFKRLKSETESKKIISDELLCCKKLSGDICGHILKLDKEEAIVKFIPNSQMVMDDSNEVHSGFIYSSANYTAMCLANKEFAITIASEVQFLSPIELEQEVIFKAKIIKSSEKKYEIGVEGLLLDIKIFEGIFHITIFDKKIFKINSKD